MHIYTCSFITAGDTLVSLPDCTKQFGVMDNIGSIRTSIKVKGSLISVKGFDYKPFGDTLTTTTGTEAQFGFMGEERDIENRYIWYGARQYDKQLGRFLSADPLLEKFVNHTSYQYAFNSPMVWKDVSGLSPEKEKRKDINQ